MNLWGIFTIIFYPKKKFIKIKDKGKKYLIITQKPLFLNDGVPRQEFSSTLSKP